MNDETRETPRTELGRADLHIHTLASDGVSGVEEILAWVEASDLDVVAITDHERIDAGVVARRLETVDRTRPVGELVLDHVAGETLPGADGRPGRVHEILEATDDGVFDNTTEFRVPEGHVFAMGDNRDNSLDSRAQNAVGFVPLENLVGRAEFIFFSVDGSARWWEIWGWPTAIRWSRLFSAVR